MGKFFFDYRQGIEARKSGEAVAAYELYRSVGETAGAVTISRFVGENQIEVLRIFFCFGRRRLSMETRRKTRVKIGPGGVCKVGLNFNTSSPFQHNK